MKTIIRYVIVTMTLFVFVGCGKIQKYTSSVIGEMKFICSEKNTIRYENVKGKHSSITFGVYFSQKMISRAQFFAVMGYDPSDETISPEKDNAVQNITWCETILFCNKLSISEGLTPVYSLAETTDPSVWLSPPTDEDRFNQTRWNAIHVNWDANGYRLPTESELLLLSNRNNPLFMWAWDFYDALPSGFYINYKGPKGYHRVGTQFNRTDGDYPIHRFFFNIFEKRNNLGFFVVRNVPVSQLLYHELFR